MCSQPQPDQHQYRPRNRRRFFLAVKEVGYDGPLVIESFDPSFEELSGNCAIWRKFADTGEELAIKGLANLRKIADAL